MQNCSCSKQSILFVIQHHLQDLFRNKSLILSKHIQQPLWIGKKKPSDIYTRACIPSRQNSTNLTGYDSYYRSAGQTHKMSRPQVHAMLAAAEGLTFEEPKKS